jgi:hypothetical protein
LRPSPRQVRFSLVAAQLSICSSTSSNAGLRHEFLRSLGRERVEALPHLHFDCDAGFSVDAETDTLGVMWRCSECCER